MFSGIVEELGTVVRLDQDSQSVRLCIESDMLNSSSGLKQGSSVMVNGVCLTVVEFEGNSRAAFDIAAETLRVTTLGQLQPSEKVNLERSLQLGSRVDGHIVQGHVDAVEKVLRRVEQSNEVCFEISLSDSIAKYVVRKGSIAVDGVSLTVGKVEAKHFEVHIIPHTLTVTTFANYKDGTEVNIETDCLARYAEGILKYTGRL